MQYHSLPLEGAYHIELDKIEDERGFFARMFCHEDFTKNQIENTFWGLFCLWVDF